MSSTPKNPVGAGRFAPSPSADLHLGNLRTAVLAWLFARSTQRQFLLRIDDLDEQRASTATAQRQVADLAALGLDFDPPMWRQSQRGAAYHAAIEQLKPHLYECFCSRREIAAATTAPHDQSPLYPGTCRELTAAERSRRRAERPPAWRIHAHNAQYAIFDQLHGTVTGQVDDLVIRRNDGTASYHLATVVDDAAMGIDQVVRAEDLLPHTPAQAWLISVLGLAPVSYVHVPLAVNTAGNRLAKRDGAITLPDLQARGTSPAQVLNTIAVSLDLAEPGEPVQLAKLLSRFVPQRLPRTPWVVESA